MEYHSATALLMLVVGLGLLVAEVFIPSGGVISVMALVALAGSGVFAWQAWWEANPAYFWAYVGSTVALVPLTFGVAFYFLPKTSWGRRILLEAPDLSELVPYRKEDEQFERLLGKYGRTLTMLNPGGLVLVEGQRVHAESQGLLIDPGEEIVVVARKGNRVVVRAAKRPAAEEAAPKEGLVSADPFEPDAAPPPETRALDFDFPQS